MLVVAWQWAVWKLAQAAFGGAPNVSFFIVVQMLWGLTNSKLLLTSWAAWWVIRCEHRNGNAADLALSDLDARELFLGKFAPLVCWLGLIMLLELGWNAISYSSHGLRVPSVWPEILYEWDVQWTVLLSMFRIVFFGLLHMLDYVPLILVVWWFCARTRGAGIVALLPAVGSYYVLLQMAAMTKSLMFVYFLGPTTYPALQLFLVRLVRVMSQTVVPLILIVALMLGLSAALAAVLLPRFRVLFLEEPMRGPYRPLRVRAMMRWLLDPAANPELQEATASALPAKDVK